MNNTTNPTASPEMFQSMNEVVDAVQELVGGAVACRIGTTLDDSRVRVKLLEDMAHFDPNHMNPELLRSAKLCRMIGSGQSFSELEACVDQIEKEQAAAESQRQSRRARTPRPPDPLNQLIRDLYQQNRKLSANQLLDELIESSSKGRVVVSVDDTKEGCVHYKTSSGTKSCKISGLPSRLTRLKRDAKVKE